MKKEAVEKIKEMLTPEVMLTSLYDEDGQIIGQCEHRYKYPWREGEPPIPWGRKFTFSADQDGNVTSTEGLF